MVAEHREYTKRKTWIAHFKRVTFMIYDYISIKLHDKITNNKAHSKLKMWTMNPCHLVSELQTPTNLYSSCGACFTDLLCKRWSFQWLHEEPDSNDDFIAEDEVKLLWVTIRRQNPGLCWWEDWKPSLCSDNPRWPPSFHDFVLLLRVLTIFSVVLFVHMLVIFTSYNLFQ